MNIPPLCFVRFARPAPIIQRGIFWYSVYRHLRLLVSPALLGDLECFIKTKPQDDPVYLFMDKKRAQGKPYYVYMTAGANKFLRIYYGRVKEYLASLPQ